MQLLVGLFDFFVHSLLCDVSDCEELAQFVLIVHSVTVDAHNFLLSLLVPRILCKNLKNAGFFKLLLLAKVKEFSQ